MKRITIFIDDIDDNEPDIKMFSYPNVCAHCSNNPANGGSGICNCTLPYMRQTTTNEGQTYITTSSSTYNLLF